MVISFFIYSEKFKYTLSIELSLLRILSIFWNALPTIFSHLSIQNLFFWIWVPAKTKAEILKTRDCAQSFNNFLDPFVGYLQTSSQINLKYFNFLT